LIRPIALFVLAFSWAAYGQENYEIQVYGSETVSPGRTMVELHSNFIFSGAKEKIGSQYPTEHALHETVEITHGWNGWAETGFYIFTSQNPGYGWRWVGSHIRPRVRVPSDWHWPVGVSLSTEVGYQRPAYSEDTWSIEVRPIVDKQVGKNYLCFNPTVERAFHGPGIRQGVVFSPNVKYGYDVSKRISAGVEYYGGLGPLNSWDPIKLQQHQIIPAIDLDLGADWEFNFGVGVGVTHTTEHLLVKLILGRRFSWGPRHSVESGRDDIPAKGPDPNATR